jgi:RNA 2',3'-cyclic 3'-phosphodiesterase
MRVFVALDIDENIRDRIALFLDGVRGFAPDARWVRPESLHVTLKFIGEKPEEYLETIRRALETIAASSFEMNFRSYGFFPSVRAPRVFWVGIEGGPKLTSLAATVDETLARLDIPKEEHAFNPHLTLARGSGGPGSVGPGSISSGSRRRRKVDDPGGSLQHLQEKLAALSAPEFGTMTSREFFLYRSQPSPGGSKYTKLAGFALR